MSLGAVEEEERSDVEHLPECLGGVRARKHMGRGVDLVDVLCHSLHLLGAHLVTFSEDGAVGEGALALLHRTCAIFETTRS